MNIGGSVTSTGTLAVSGTSTFSGLVTTASLTVNGTLTAPNFATSNVSTGVLTGNDVYSSFTGLTITYGSKELQYSRVGKICTVAVKITWTSSTGTWDGNVAVSSPFNGRWRPDLYTTVSCQVHGTDLGNVRGYHTLQNSIRFVLNPASVGAVNAGTEFYFMYTYLCAD
jgi:hypothetical protein